jgi:hypothetical protein
MWHYKGGPEKGWVGGGRDLGDAGFCGLCACLGVLLLLQWRVLCQGFQGAWGVYSLYSKLVSK